MCELQDSLAVSGKELVVLSAVLQLTLEAIFLLLDQIWLSKIVTRFWKIVG